MKTSFAVITLSICLLGTTWAIGASDNPSVLSCTVNAHADRNWGFDENVWMGPIPKLGKAPDPSRPFNVATMPNQNGVIFRDKVFSAINTPKPVIRSITQGIGNGETESVEFEGAVLSRTSGALFISWQNPYGNKVWVAAIDLINRKAVLSLLSQGATSLNIDVETLNCR